MKFKAVIVFNLMICLTLSEKSWSISTVLIRFMRPMKSTNDSAKSFRRHTSRYLHSFDCSLSSVRLYIIEKSASVSWAEQASSDTDVVRFTMSTSRIRNISTSPRHSINTRWLLKRRFAINEAKFANDLFSSTLLSSFSNLELFE